VNVFSTRESLTNESPYICVYIYMNLYTYVYVCLYICVNVFSKRESLERFFFLEIWQILLSYTHAHTLTHPHSLSPFLPVTIESDKPFSLSLSLAFFLFLSTSLSLLFFLCVRLSLPPPLPFSYHVRPGIRCLLLLPHIQIHKRQKSHIYVHT